MSIIRYHSLIIRVSQLNHLTKAPLFYCKNPKNNNPVDNVTTVSSVLTNVKSGLDLSAFVSPTGAVD